MSREIVVATLRDDEASEYQGFLARQEDASVYHTTAWHRVLHRALGYRAEVLVARRGEELVGALPLAIVDTMIGGRRLVSLPFSHRVPILAEDGAVQRGLIDAAVERASAERCRFLEVRHGTDLDAGAGWSASTDYVNSITPLLPDEEEQLAALRSNTRNQLRQGMRDDELRVETRDDPAGFALFERLVALTRQRKGAPTYPTAFFTELRESLVGAGLARLELAFAGARCIAALVTMSFGKQAIYGYSGSSDDREDLRRRPVNVLMWRGMNWAREQGAAVFDLGTSLVGQDGLVHFKEGWGAVTAPMATCTWAPSAGGGRSISQEGSVATLASSILRRVPFSVFRRVSPFLLRQVG